MKFKIHYGKHFDGRRSYKPGAIIETHTDLTKFNVQGHLPRFERVADDAKEVPKEEVPDTKAAVAGKDDKAADDGLEAMTQKELIEIAVANEIDISKCKQKADIIRVLREYM